MTWKTIEVIRWGVSSFSNSQKKIRKQLTFKMKSPVHN